jgi:hypothetical protein
MWRKNMKNYILLGLSVALLVSCNTPNTDPPVVAPKLNPKLVVPRVIASNQTTLTFKGQDLQKADQVKIGGQVVTLGAIAPDSINVTLPAALKSGDYSIEFIDKDQHTFRSEKGLLVVPQEINNADPKYLEPHTALLLVNPKVLNLGISALEKAGFKVEVKYDPFVAGGSGICSQVILSLQDTLSDGRSTMDGLNALIESLGSSIDGDDFIINPRVVSWGPDSYTKPPRVFLSNTQSTKPPPTIPPVQPPVPPPTVPPVEPPVPVAALPTFSTAVLDTGMGSTSIFGQFSSTVDASAWRNFTFPNTNTNPFNDDALERGPDGTLIKTQNVGHGTPVAAAAAGLSATNVVPIKVCDKDGKCKLPSLLAGVCYATSLANRASMPVKVMNLSLNSPYHSPIFYQALQEASSAGISIVVSSGNQRNEKTTPLNPDSYPAYYSVDKAGQHTAIPGLMAVGSVGQSRATTAGLVLPSSFSSEGPWVTLSAFGENVSLPRADTGEFYPFTGTSFSAPQVAGMAMRILGLNPSFTPAQIRAELLAKAVTPLPNCPSSRCGAGYLNRNAFLK